MKTIAMLLYFIPGLYNTTPSMEEVRSLYISAAKSEVACTELLEILSNEETTSGSLFLGYKGCAYILKAKYAFYPITKLNYFSKGKKMLEQSIACNINNIELRYLRFTIQTNAPAFLGYRSNIDEDKFFLLNAVKKISDTSLKEYIISFLKNSDYVSNSEKTKL